ncbi:hypothetical protein N7G274_003969 [Stereocaulon virgatum]|uniref:Aminoglycoside phosphotransferase domain-containing protein n=1 Tax=Stereocaulon virgatum TaxID=373712 RepID=A0ABR4ACW4_9LECA
MALDEVAPGQPSPATLISTEPHSTAEVRSVPSRNATSSTSSSSTAGSSTSTLEYGHEPWDEFRERVKNLCGNLWPPQTTITYRFSNSHAAQRLRSIKLLGSLVPAPQAPVIERLHGGGNNRITGITLPSFHAADKFILRVPRDDQARPDREVAILDYVREHTTFPIPTIAGKDFSCNNPLAKPYVLQYRIPGCDLNKIWSEISHSQRCDVAREVGCVIRTLLSLESPVPGLVEPGSNDVVNAKTPHIVPFELKGPDGEIVQEPEAYMARDFGTTLNLFQTQFKRWRAWALDRSHGHILRNVELYDAMLEIANEMNALGLFTDENCLCHIDLHPRNIMVKANSDVPLLITAFLDWDDAVFAPKAVNCEPPWWLWDDEGDEHLDEDECDPWPYELKGANELPSTTEKQELKRILEEHAGPEYNRMAYNEPSRLLRCLFRLATVGLTASHHYKAAEKVLADWDVLRDSLMHSG